MRPDKLVAKALRRLSRAEIIVFSAIFLMLIIKFLLVTRWATSPTDFLSSYKFVSSDSYDWVANGLRLFHNDSITFRNPGFVLIIKFLSYIKALFLLPLLGNLAFFVLIIFVYRLSRLLVTRSIALTLAAFLALNFSLNLAANFILADIYAVAFIAVSLYYLTQKRYWLSFFMLGLSMLFQDFGYFLLVFWLAYFGLENWPRLKKGWQKRQYRYFAEGILRFGLTLLPAIAWNLYKFIKFGNPLYTKLGYSGLIRPNFNSVGFYAIGSLSFFGMVVVPFLASSLLSVKKILKDRLLSLLWVGLLFNVLFWFIIYDWNDKRFLLYFIPFVWPLLAHYFGKLHQAGRFKLAIGLLLVYPTILPVSSLLSGREIPLVHNLYLSDDVAPKTGQPGLTFHQRPGFGSPLMDLDPTIFQSLQDHAKYHQLGNTTYTSYVTYIARNYRPPDNAICISNQKPISVYNVKSILLISQNINVGELRVEDCGAIR